MIVSPTERPRKLYASAHPQTCPILHYYHEGLTRWIVGKEKEKLESLFPKLLVSKKDSETELKRLHFLFDQAIEIFPAVPMKTGNETSRDKLKWWKEHNILVNDPRDSNWWSTTIIVWVAKETYRITGDEQIITKAIDLFERVCEV